MPFTPVGSHNGYIPSWEATGQIIKFMRSPDAFPINNYIAFRPATKMQGVYIEINSKNAIRVGNDTDYMWPDGAERPIGRDNRLEFQFKPYRCERQNFAADPIGDLTVQQSDWPVMATRAEQSATQGMTLLTKKCVNYLDNSSNWGSNVATATALGGGFIGAGTSTNPILRKLFGDVVRRIKLGTNATMGRAQISCVLDPVQALAIASSAEFHDYLKGSPDAKAQVEGRQPNYNIDYQLPEVLYGVKIVVEDTVIENAKVGATSSTAFVKDSNKMFFTYKVDGIKGDFVGETQKQTANFSTFQLFYCGKSGTKEDGTGLVEVQYYYDVRNERTMIDVVMSTDPRMVAVETGFMVTNTLS